MIDLHAHILPGLDDGADSMETSLKMLSGAESAGTTVLVATPHFMPGVYETPGEEIERIFNEFRVHARNEKIGVELHLSRECAATLDVLERIKKGHAATLGEGGRYILIELDYSHVAPWIDEVIYKLLIEEITPIIVHPERNGEIIKDPNQMYDLVQKGCLGQVNASSLAGRFGPEVQRCAETLVKHHLAHVIASDAHSHHTRTPDMREGYHRLVELLGEEEARLFVESRPRRILEGAPILKEMPQRVLELEPDEEGYLARIRKMIGLPSKEI